MNIRNILLFILLFFCLGVPVAKGQEVIKISLKEAVQRALSEEVVAKLAALKVETSKNTSNLARSALLPHLEGHVIESNIVANLNTIGLIDIPGIPQKVGPFDVFDAHIQVSLHVIDLAAIGHFFAARKGILATQMEKQKTENEVAAAVALLYVSFQRAGSQVKEVDANVRLFQKLLKISQDQFKVGLATQLDVHRMELQWANQQQALLLAQEQKEKVKLAFLHAIGADLGAELILTDPLRHEARTLPSLEEALSFALLQRPEVSQWKEAILAMDHQLRAEKASRFPSLDVRFWGGFSGVSLDELQGNRILMADLTIPIFNGGQTESKIKEAQLKRQQAAYQKQETLLQIEEDVRRTYLSYQTSNNRSKVAEKNFRLAQEEMILATDRFTNGVGNSLEMDNAETAFIQARENRLLSLADEAQTWFDFRRATGLIADLIPGRNPQ